MNLRLRPVVRRVAIVTSAAPLLSLPWLNAWMLVPLALAAVVFAVANELVARQRRIAPMVALLPLVQALSVAAIVVNGRELRGDLMLVLSTLVPVSGGFPARFVRAYALWTAALIVVVTVGLHPSAVTKDPMLVLAPLAMVHGVTVLSTAIREAGVQHRQDAVVDRLTGLSNRSALAERVVDLARLSSSNAFGVGVVVLDLDHFKQVNDTHGHQRGDEVLKDLTQRVHAELRTLDLVYRIGGEEFVVLVPDATAAQAAVLAQRLVTVIRSRPLAGVAVTASAGVAASPAGRPFDYDDVFARADAALYAAKHAGRDRVRLEDVAPGPGRGVAVR